MTDSSPPALARHLDDYDWDYIPGERGKENVMRWKTLIGNQLTDTRAISFGIVELPSGTKLDPHFHAEHEVYYVYKGEGEVLLDDQIVAVKPGSVLFVPGDLKHAVRNHGKTTLCMMWIFPSDKWVDIEYHMLDETF